MARDNNYLTGDEAKAFCNKMLQTSFADQPRIWGLPENAKAGYFPEDGGYSAFDNRTGKMNVEHYHNDATCLLWLDGTLDELEKMEVKEHVPEVPVKWMLAGQVPPESGYYWLCLQSKVDGVYQFERVFWDAERRIVMQFCGTCPLKQLARLTRNDYTFGTGELRTTIPAHLPD